jgi:hypothetical protein
MNESNANPIDILAQDLAPIELQTDEDRSYARKITEKILELLEEKDYKRVMKLIDKPKRTDNPEYQALLVKMRLTDPYQDLRFLAVTDRLFVIKNLMHIIEALPNPNLSVHTEVQGIDRNEPISRDSIRELMQEYIGKNSLSEDAVNILAKLSEIMAVSLACINKSRVVPKEIEAEMNEYQKMKIEDLDLSVRAYNALRRAGINTLADIVQAHAEGRLDKIRNAGITSKSYREIYERMGKICGEEFLEKAKDCWWISK